MKRFFVKRARRRCGISLLETVIALAIISVISAATVTLIVASSRAEARILNDMYITNAAENAVECFQYAENSDELLTLLQRTDAAYAVSGEDPQRIFLTKSTYTVTVLADFVGNTVEIYATDEDGEEIYRLAYQKGDLI